MLAQSFASDGHVSLSNYAALFSSRHGWALLRNSIVLSFCSTFIASAGGVLLGILFGKSDLPFSRFFLVTFSLPLLLPPYIIAVS